MLACKGIFVPHVNGAGARSAHRATPKDLRSKAFCVYYNTFSNFFKAFLNFFGKNNWFFRHNPPKRKLFLVRAVILCFCDLFFKAFLKKYTPPSRVITTEFVVGRLATPTCLHAVLKFCESLTLFAILS